MNRLWNKITESFFSVAPIIVIVVALQFTLVPMPIEIMTLFAIGAVLLIIGMGLFGLGADVAMMPMGQHIGSRLTKTKKLIILLPLTFLLGALITAAEPDLHVLANQVPSVPNLVLILFVAIGVGLFLIIAMLRILYQIRLSILLSALYLLVFIAATFLPESYLAVAFDSGGVTTGPVTVPFILALGVGLSSVLGGNRSHDDSFGLVALCSVGPILSVMVMGLFFDPTNISYAAETSVYSFGTWQDAAAPFLHGLKRYSRDVAVALLPILLFFAVFQITVIRLNKQQLAKIGIGLVYSFTGLALFLSGANVGLIPAGKYIGQALGESPNHWVLIPLGALMGFFVVAAEPAVHILTNQVWDMTAGAISKRALMGSLSIGVAISIALALTRILYDFSIWYLILPGYAIAIALTRFAPPVFTAIAFDSGGVASGPMTATFLLALSMGTCEAVGGNLLTDAFGLVTMVAMTPLITIQVLGLVYQRVLRTTAQEESEAIAEVSETAEEGYLEWVNCDTCAEGVEWREPLIAVATSEWVENLDWANEIEHHRRVADIASDNYYISLE